MPSSSSPDPWFLQLSAIFPATHLPKSMPPCLDLCEKNTNRSRPPTLGGRTCGRFPHRAEFSFLSLLLLFVFQVSQGAPILQKFAHRTRRTRVQLLIVEL